MTIIYYYKILFWIYKNVYFWYPQILHKNQYMILSKDIWSESNNIVKVKMKWKGIAERKYTTSVKTLNLS